MPKPMPPVDSWEWKRKCGTFISAKVNIGLMPPACDLVCAACERQAAYYHHPDYRLPECVVALCGKCHRTIHSTKRVKSMRLLFAIASATVQWPEQDEEED